MVKEARLAELKNEVCPAGGVFVLRDVRWCHVLLSARPQLLASQALKAHFEDNPRDLAVLRHDKPLQPNAVCVVFPRVSVAAVVELFPAVQVPSHLAHVPDYLVPQSLRAAAAAAGGGLSTKKRTREGGVDPLKSFAYNVKKLGGAVGSGKAVSAMFRNLACLVACTRGVGVIVGNLPMSRRRSPRATLPRVNPRPCVVNGRNVTGVASGTRSALRPLAASD